MPSLGLLKRYFREQLHIGLLDKGEQSFHNLIYWNEVDEGGHFAAWEQPELFAADPVGAVLQTGAAARPTTERLSRLKIEILP